MYQQVLRRFAHFNAIQLSDPAPLPELIMLALKEEDTDADGSDNDDLRKKIAEVITSLFIHFSWKSLWVLGLGTPSTLSFNHLYRYVACISVGLADIKKHGKWNCHIAYW